MRTMSIKIPEEVTHYLQRLSYEMEGLRVLHTHALECDLPEEKLKGIKEEYLSRTNEFNLARCEIDNNYVKPNFNNPVQWNLDYGESVLYVDIEV